MLERARANAGRSVGLKLGNAESLPFKDGWFERALCFLVVHLVDRPRALPELARVLAPTGRAVIATFHPENFDRIWLASFFPSLPAIDKARFPKPERLAGELAEAGFSSVRIRDVTQRASVTREDALEKLRGRYISTLWLLPDDEYRAGVERAERDLAPTTEYSREWAIVVAERT